MASIFSGFGSFGGIVNLVKLGGIFLIFLLIGLCIAAMVIMVLVKKKQKKIVEINMVTRRARIFNGRLKKKKKGVKQFWAAKLNKFLPEFQQKSVFTKGTQDMVILFTDNNGLHHTARVPTYNQLKKWYKVVHGIDLSKKTDQDTINKLKDIYLLPNPHEDLDWLSGQCTEADKEFKPDNWFNSPVVAYVATGFICFMMIIMTIILEKKL